MQIFKLEIYENVLKSIRGSSLKIRGSSLKIRGSSLKIRGSSLKISSWHTLIYID